MRRKKRQIDNLRLEKAGKRSSNLARSQRKGADREDLKEKEQA
jgi:hypothetical protein